MAHVLTVNVASPQPNPADESLLTGIGKQPTHDRVAVRPPGSAQDGGWSGIVGDFIGDRHFHGGDDQAVYAYAREDLDNWQPVVGHPIANGGFGENLTTSGVDVTNSVIGERWQVGGGGGPVLEVSAPRIPCRTFAAWLDERGWVKTFTQASIPGAYLRVLSPGTVCAGDEIVVTDRPDHGVTTGLVFRALTTEPESLPKVLVADALSDDVKMRARKRIR